MKNGSMLSSCGTTPIAARAWRGSKSMSMPQIAARPELLMTSPARMLMSVDLPAPLGPRSPKSAPRGIARSTWSSAVFAGMRLAAR